MSDLQLEMKRSWRNQFRLPDNLPLLVGHRLSSLPLERRTSIENKVGFSKTKWDDTHPCDADRVREARQLAQPGYEISDEPARDLFENFPAVSRMVTMAYYEDDLQVPIEEAFLIPTTEMMAAK